MKVRITPPILLAVCIASAAGTTQDGTRTVSCSDARGNEVTCRSEVPSGSSERRPRAASAEERAAEAERNRLEREMKASAERAERTRLALADAQRRIRGEIVMTSVRAVPADNVTSRVDSSAGGTFFGASTTLSLAAPLITSVRQAQRAAPIPIDRARRAAAILSTVPAQTPNEFESVLDMRPELLHFLAEEAAAALEGRPLRVLLDDVRLEARHEEAQRLALNLQRLEAAVSRYEGAANERRRLDGEIRSAQSRRPPGAARDREIAIVVGAREDSRRAELRARDESVRITTAVFLNGRRIQ